MKNILTLFPALAAAFILLAPACGSEPETEQDEAPILEQGEIRALTLLRNNCFSCHSPEMGQESRVAPPMFKIREHYLAEGQPEEEFIQKIIHFVNNPSEENSIMPGAVRNFGMMPRLQFKEEDLRVMAAYIYANDLESDEWYERWKVFKNLPASATEQLSYADLGLNYANGAKSQLGKNLLAAIQERGPAGAVEFCNTRAITLTDSMAQVYQVGIRRVSDQPRNPLNKANETELAYIREMKTVLANGGKSHPKVFEQNGKMMGYYPIETNKMCLQCHGKPSADIEPATMQKIAALYPEDRATGYGENELRGLFVVEMKK